MTEVPLPDLTNRWPASAAPPAEDDSVPHFVVTAELRNGWLRARLQNLCYGS